MLKNIPKSYRLAARDGALLLVGTLVSWVLSDIVPVLNHAGGAAAVIGAALTLAASALTPIVRQYGVGAVPPAKP